MDMKNHSVRRIFPRLLPSSFTSCQFRHVPDIVESSITMTKTQPTNSSLSKTHKSKAIRDDPRLNKLLNKVSYLGSDAGCKRCPPVTPASAFNIIERDEKARVVKIKNGSSSNSVWFSSENSEVDGETNTFFSLSASSSESFRIKTAENIKGTDQKGRCSSEVSVKSIGSLFAGGTNTKPCQKTAKTCEKKEMNYEELQKKNSKLEKRFEVPGIPAEVYYGARTRRNCRPKAPIGLKTQKNRRRTRRVTSTGEFGSCPILVDGRLLEESYAVEKSSSDPYNDLRISMVEMIVEKQIFGDEDLERLLHCFLSLNLPCYHKVIVEVFLEICETLFTN